MGAGFKRIGVSLEVQKTLVKKGTSGIARGGWGQRRTNETGEPWGVTAEQGGRMVEEGPEDYLEKEEKGDVNPPISTAHRNLLGRRVKQAGGYHTKKKREEGFGKSEERWKL